MYELLVLSLLMRFPAHAYLIAKITNDIIGPWEQISRGTLSALLTKMEQAGLITDADPARIPFPPERPARVLAITPAGRSRFIELMLDTTSNLGAYQRLFHLKAQSLEFLLLADRLYVIDHYVRYGQAVVDHMEREAGEFARNPRESESGGSFFRTSVLDLMQLGIDQWQLEITWAQHLRERVESAK